MDWRLQHLPYCGLLSWQTFKLQKWKETFRAQNNNTRQQLTPRSWKKCKISSPYPWDLHLSHKMAVSNKSMQILRTRNGRWTLNVGSQTFSRCHRDNNVNHNKRKMANDLLLNLRLEVSYNLYQRFFSVIWPPIWSSIPFHLCEFKGSSFVSKYE